MSARILGQKAGTGAIQDLYSPPVGQEAVTSTLVLANTGTSTRQGTVRVAPGGAIDAVAQTVVPTFSLNAGERVGFTEGWCLAAGDVLRVNTHADVVATLFGDQTAAS